MTALPDASPVADSPPPRRVQGFAKLADLACRFAAPPAIGVLAALLPPDASFDLANYHFFNGWHFFQRSESAALFTSGLMFFVNPLLDVPFFLLHQHLPGRLVAFALGFVQGLCFPLLYLLSRRFLDRGATVADVLLAGCVAFCGCTGAVFVSELGTTYYDYVGAVGFLWCLLLLPRNDPIAPGVAVPALGRQAGLRLLAAGAVLGAVIGLKQTNIALGLGVGLALPLLFRTPRPAAIATGLFGLGGITGVLATGGWWMLDLYRQFGSPLFPFYNNVFHSPFAPAAPIIDGRFLPAGSLEALALPVTMLWQLTRTTEIPIRDSRITVLFVVALLALAARAVGRLRRVSSAPAATRSEPAPPITFLIVMSLLAIAIWVMLFSIRRYLLPLEICAPLIVLVVVGGFGSVGRKPAVVVAFLIATIATALPATWGRNTWQATGGAIVSVQLPALDFSSRDLVLLAGWRPKSFVVPFLPPGTKSAFLSGDQISTAALSHLAGDVKRLIAGHDGRIIVLVHSAEATADDTAALLGPIEAFGLTVELARCAPIVSSMDLKGPVLACTARRKGA